MMPGVALLHAGAQLQRIDLDDRRHRRALADVLADLHQPLGDDAGDRRADDGVGELLRGEVVGGAAILQERLLSANVVDRGLVRRLGHLQPRVRRLQVDRREDAARGERLCAIAAGARVFPVGHGVSDRPDLVVGGRRVGGVDRPVHAELRARLPERALGAGERERELLRSEPDQRITGADFAANLDQHLPDDPRRFGAHSRLIRRH